MLYTVRFERTKEKGKEVTKLHLGIPVAMVAIVIIVLLFGDKDILVAVLQALRLP